MKIYGYVKEIYCIKCGSYATGRPVWHARTSNFYLSWVWPIVHHCWGMALDHLHLHCDTCGHSWAMACADIKENVT